MHHKGKYRMISEIKLAEMLCTRLCHDLTGPIGAVNNGAEFLAEEGFDMQNEAMQLIVTSAHEAVNRLQFYRQVYGRVNDHGEASLSEKKSLSADFFSGTKLKLDWPDSHTDASGISVSQKMARLIMNLMIVVQGAMIRGGTLSIRVSETPDAREFSLVAEGETVKLEPETLEILHGNGDASMLSPKTAQLFLTAKLAGELDASVQIDVAGGKLSILARQNVTVAQLAAQ
jgi:histidine phosphotransferase ChpT